MDLPKGGKVMDLPKEILERITWKETKRTTDPELPTIVRIAPIVKECEQGCGKIIYEHQGYTLAKRLTPINYWQSMCKVCKKYKNPDTGEYNCSLGELNAILKPKKR